MSQVTTLETSNGKLQYVEYTKESVIGKIGIRQIIYDMICKGDLNIPIRYITFIKPNKESDSELILKEFMESTECMDQSCFYLCTPGALIMNETGRTVISDRVLTAEKINSEMKLLSEYEFHKIRLGKRLRGNMDVMMLYSAGPDKEANTLILDNLRKNKIIQDA